MTKFSDLRKTEFAVVAQLVERLLAMQKVCGSKSRLLLHMQE